MKAPATSPAPRPVAAAPRLRDTPSAPRFRDARLAPLLRDARLAPLRRGTRLAPLGRGAPVARWLRAGSAVLALFALVPLAGCDTVIEGPLPPVLDLAPEPRTPVAAIDRLLWAWQRRDTLALEQLYTGNFRFAYPASDTVTTAPARGGPVLAADDTLEWFREEERAISARLFVRGTSARPAATAISIVLDTLLIDVPDPRPGRAARWHRAIHMRSAAGIRLPAGYLRVDDASVFYVVRGDSAQIPFELQARGVRPDSTWWWIERWEEATTPAPSEAFLDYARLKLMYRSP